MYQMLTMTIQIQTWLKLRRLNLITKSKNSILHSKMRKTNRKYKLMKMKKSFSKVVIGESLCLFYIVLQNLCLTVHKMKEVVMMLEDCNSFKSLKSLRFKSVKKTHLKAKIALSQKQNLKNKFKLKFQKIYK